MPDKKVPIIEIDVNEEVEVRLTRLGWAIYKKYSAFYYPRGTPKEFRTDHGLWVRLPLWEFMHIFGSELRMGVPHVVWHGKIMVPKKFSKEI